MGCMADAGAGEMGKTRGVTDEDDAGSVTKLIEAGRDREAALRGARTAGAVPAPEAPAAPAAPEQNRGTMDPLTQLDQLAPALGGVVGGIRPDQLDQSTPCDEFTVRGVLEHMVTGATAFAGAFRGETPATPDLSDPLAAFGPALGDLGSAISAPGALDRTIAAPFGEVPGETFARFVVLDGLVHGWDMAVATGQDYAPPDDLVAAAREFAEGAIDPLRDGVTFGPAVTPSGDATPIERLAAFTGRQSLP